jgi:hypothetical protein
MAVQGMVHALERIGRHLQPDGVLVLIQPHQRKRPFIAITSARERWRVAALVSPEFQPLVNAAMAAIQTVIDRRRFVLIGRSEHGFSVRLGSQAELHRYLHQAPRPARFPSGGRQRLQHLWAQRRAATKIEVTEFLTVVALRATRSESEKPGPR